MFKWIILGIIIISIGLIFRMLWEKNHFQTNYYTMVDERFSQNKEPVKTVVLADLHNQSFEKDNERLLCAIDKINPSCIFIAGDMLVGVPGKSTDVAASFMEKLAKKYDIYYGIGNHEYRMRIYPETYGNAYDKYNERLQTSNIEMLHNERRTVKLGKVEADVYGLEMDRKYYKRFRKTPMDVEYLNDTLDKPREDTFSILLAHSPDYFKTYVKWGADLTLAGHVHGGAIRIGNIGILSPSTGLFPKYSGGWYEQDGKRMLVSRGLGAHTIPIRLFNRPELIVLEFKGIM